MTKKYLVTGGAGFIGSALVRRLIIDGYEVRVLDNSSRGSLDRLKNLKNVEIVEGGVRDADGN